MQILYVKLFWVCVHNVSYTFNFEFAKKRIILSEINYLMQKISLVIPTVIIIFFRGVLTLQNQILLKGLFDLKNF